MTEPARDLALSNLQLAVTALTRQLDVASGLPPQGLEDLKSALDDARLRLWGVLMASNTGDYQGFADRFRMRRAAEMCRSLADDAQAGKLTLGCHEAGELAASVRTLSQRLGSAPLQP